MTWGIFIPIGTKVRITGFPRPQDPHNSFVWNGRVGKVTNVKKYSVADATIHEYEVEFKNVNFQRVSRNLDGTLKREEEVTDAKNWFNEGFLEIVE